MYPKWDKNYFTYVELLEKYLRLIKPKRILEWGPGHSTRIMIIKCPRAEIISYENDKHWFKKYNDEFGNKVKLILIEAPLENRKSLIWKQYTNPALEGKFDLVFIDGHERVRCMKTTTKLLSKNGVVILHDCRKRGYQEGIELFDTIEKANNTLCLKRKNALP